MPVVCPLGGGGGGEGRARALGIYWYINIGWFLYYNSSRNLARQWLFVFAFFSSFKCCKKFDKICANICADSKINEISLGWVY